MFLFKEEKCAFGGRVDSPLLYWESDELVCLYLFVAPPDSLLICVAWESRLRFHLREYDAV